MSANLSQKVVVITGASGGIGAALAELVGARGGRPVLAARRVAALEAVAARSGPEALAIPTDVTRPTEVQALCAAARARFGHIDVWVNNAGRGITRPVTQLTDEDFDEMMLVNVKSALYGMRAVLPHFQERGQGHLINVSSLLGRLPYVSVRSAYSAAKHALNALTANLRMDLRATYPGIQVSTVHPGPVATEFGLNALGGGADSRALPYAQPAAEVAEVIADLIVTPRPDAYTRPAYRDQVTRYFAAEDVSEIEGQPPFLPAGGPGPAGHAANQPKKQ
jgi:NAD(P)-dependent dehydrogenase (short-subunit alcohol dehydrogenase family)